MRITFASLKNNNKKQQKKQKSWSTGSWSTSIDSIKRPAKLAWEI